MESKNSVTPSIENDAKEAAHGYIARGWSVVPVPHGEKGPKLDGWQKLRIKPEQVGESFTEGSNIGIQLGEASGGLADVDLDCPEAEHAGNKLLPATLTSGRGNKTRHHWYTSPSSRSFKFKDVDSDVLVEVRADGGYQTLVEPSIHPTGERYVWQNDAEPLEIEAHELRSAAARVAVSALIARHLPAKTRHDTALAYAGYVLKNLMELGEDQDDATEYVWNILDPAWACKDSDEEGRKDLYAAIEGTASKLYAGEEQITGAGYLRENLEHGEGIVKRIKEWLGWELSDEQREAVEQRQRVKRAEKAIADPKVSELAHAPDILDRVYKIMQDGGLVGEERNAKLLTLVAATMHLGRPMSLLLNDDSSSGKSYLLKQLVKTLPNEMLYMVQSVSNMGLSQVGKYALKNKFLLVYELGGLGQKGSDAIEQLKALLTEGSIRRRIAESTNNGVGGRMVEVDGPTALLTTTTETFMDRELANRMFKVSLDTSPEQTRQIIKARRKRNTGSADYEPVRGLHTYLAGQDNRVSVPFEDEIADLVDVSANRMRRDYDRIMDLIEAHAVLHQESRERDGEGCIVATLDDYEAVHDLIADIVGEASEVSVSDTVRETVERVRELITEGEEVTRNTLAKKFGIVPTSAGRRFGPATAAGFVKEDPDNPNQKPKRYVLGEVDLPENLDAIPSPETLTSCVRARRAGTPPDSNEEHKTDARSNARSDARMHARSVSEDIKSDRYRESGDEKDEAGVSPETTHGRTIFADEPENGDEGRTVRDILRNIVRRDPADVDASFANKNPQIWDFVMSLPPEFIDPLGDEVAELRELYGPNYRITTPHQLMFTYIRDGYAKPKFRIKQGYRELVGLVAA